MNKQQKCMLLESLDDSRLGEIECSENGDDEHTAYIYQGWVEALEYVIGIYGLTEKEFRKKSEKATKKKRKKCD